MWPCVSIARSYKGTRLLCWGEGRRGERREKWMILEIFVSWSIRAISKLLKDIGRIFCATTGKVRKKLILRSRKLIITLHRVDRSPRFVPTQEGRPSLKISISIQWNGAKFRNIRGICQPHKGKIPVHPKFPNLHAHTSRETIPFPINETRVKASVQLNGSPLRPTTPPATKPHSPNMREKLIRFAFTIVFYDLLPLSISIRGGNQVAALWWKVIRDNFCDYSAHRYAPLDRKRRDCSRFIQRSNELVSFRFRCFMVCRYVRLFPFLGSLNPPIDIPCMLTGKW